MSQFINFLAYDFSYNRLDVRRSIQKMPSIENIQYCVHSLSFATLVFSISKFII